MGTLTGNQVRLPDFCDHKLPTSCRLSSIPTCCACADERAHALSYSTYIDGIGFVPRGNRWQRYCWYCKEFWERRVDASGLRPSQTRIPQEPDQKEFLERWYEFHRGYRIVTNNDGREERVAVLGEDFKDVSPGCLPRTLEEMRAGRRVAEEVQPTVHQTLQVQEDVGPTLDERLDQIFADAIHEEDREPAEASVSSQQPAAGAPAPRNNIHAQAMNPVATRDHEYQVRRVAALRRELNRMRTGISRVISGLRDLGESVPDDTESVGVFQRLDDILGAPSRRNIVSNTSAPNNTTERTLNTLQARIREAQDQLHSALQAREQAAADHEAARAEFQASQQRLQQLQREERTMENYTRIFGTREEMIAQGEDYESPIGSFFSRAYERFRAAEDVRREQRTLRQVLEDEERIDRDEAVARRLEELETRERDVWGVPQMHLQSERREQSLTASVVGPEIAASETGSAAVEVTIRDVDENETPPVLSNTSEEAMLEQYYALVRRQERDQNNAREGVQGDSQQETEPDFPRQMLAAIVEARARELAESDPLSPEPDRDSDEVAPPHFSEDEWWHSDAEIILRALTTDDEVRQEANISAEDAGGMLEYFTDGMVSEYDRMTIDGWLRHPRIIWRTGLPAEWLQRRQDLIQAGRIPDIFFTGGGGEGGSDDWARHHNPYIRIEVAAQAFMISAEVRRSAPNLTPPERLQMLYRLQAGSRTDSDVQTLSDIDRTGNWRGLAEVTRRRLLSGESDPRTDRLNQARREMARNGNHSRRELEARRRDVSTREFALAAGRQAMQTGPQTLLERMAAQQIGADEVRSTTYRQLTLSDYLTSSPGSSRSSSQDSARGLDAADSGRPEPKTEEELTVQMDCKICYTQMAEVACLPCGHLVMCRWCSDQHSPCLPHNRTQPRRAAACPVCRKGIRQKVRVFRG